MSKRSIDNLILEWKGWSDFYASVSSLENETDKGDCFERLMQLYMQSAPHMISRYKHVWLRSEVPGEVKKHLSLPDTDEGIDVIAETHDGKFHSGQAKFRSTPAQSLTMREVVTFTNLSFVHCNNIAHGLIAHTCELPITKRALLGNIAEIGLDVWDTLNSEDWAAIQARIAGREMHLAARLPRPHQQAALADAVAHFVHNGACRGRLIMPCGTGKSLAAFFISEQLNPQTVVVAVPSLSLIAQSLRDWTREFLARGQVPDWFVVCSADDAGDISDDDYVGDTYEHGLETDTSLDAIEAWLRRTKDSRRRIVFVTYQSGRKFAEAARNVDLLVDFMILDEAHKTVGARDKTFTHLLFDKNVKAARRMFMTATQRVPLGEDDRVLSMDDVTVYGEQFHLLTCKAAVDQGIICDYEIVIMAVYQTDIADLVRRNALVNTDIAGLDEAQSMRLATGIALKKMYQERDVRHAISFHASILKATQFREQQDALNTVETLGPPAVNLHISSKLPMTQRKLLMRKFPTYRRALVTNARCLTEGVDIPAIDCVVFADRKNSTVDIVQAAGRAMRRAPDTDKTKGYILLPLIVDDDLDAEGIEAFAKKSGFREVARIVTALSTNDERIVEQFRAVHNGDQLPSGGAIIRVDGSVRLGLHIEFDKFAEAIEEKIWERLARISPRSYDEAVVFVHALGLKGVTDWYSYCRGERAELPPKPADIPRVPSYVYGKDFRARGGWGAWFGTDHRKGGWLPYDEAAAFVRNLGLKNQADWFAYYRGERPNLPRKPTNIPDAPWKVYGELFRERGGLGAWLGTGNVHPQYKKWLSYDDALKVVHALNLKNVREWREYIRGSRADLPPMPDDVPMNPPGLYGEEFRARGGWGAWFGTGHRRGGWRSFDNATTFVHKLGLKSRAEWESYCRGERMDLPGKPADIPSSPWPVYGDNLRERGGFSAWLGTGTIPTKDRRKRLYRSYDDSVTFVHGLGLKNQKAWGSYCGGERRELPAKPEHIPANPKQVYRDEFSSRGGWGAWLGTGNQKRGSIKYRSYNAAIKFVHPLGLKSATEWRAYCSGRRTGLPVRPVDIPANPWTMYGDEFRKRGGIGAWLGFAELSGGT